jgi:hypothetical protein
MYDRNVRSLILLILKQRYGDAWVSDNEVRIGEGGGLLDWPAAAMLALQAVETAAPESMEALDAQN